MFRFSGAGYKILCAARGWSDLYATSGGSTFKWDTCAGHAILLSLGGDLWDLKAKQRVEYHKPLAGKEGAQRHANGGGLLAFKDKEVAKEFLENVL